MYSHTKFLKAIFGHDYKTYVSVLYNLHLYCLLVIALLIAVTGYTLRKKCPAIRN